MLGEGLFRKLFNSEKPSHPRIKKRSAELQEYRNNLAKVLRGKRARGEVGKTSAKITLGIEKKKLEYILSEYGFTKKGADRLIEVGMGGFVARHLQDFEGLDQSLTEKLVK